MSADDNKSMKNSPTYSFYAYVISIIYQSLVCWLIYPELVASGADQGLLEGGGGGGGGGVHNTKTCGVHFADFISFFS